MRFCQAKLYNITLVSIRSSLTESLLWFPFKIPLKINKHKIKVSPKYKWPDLSLRAPTTKIKDGMVKKTATYKETCKKN